MKIRTTLVTSVVSVSVIGLPSIRGSYINLPTARDGTTKVLFSEDDLDKLHSFRVQTRDELSNVSYDKQARLGVRGLGCVKLEDVVDEENSFYTVTYRVVPAGGGKTSDGKIDVLLNGTHVINSPVYVSICTSSAIVNTTVSSRAGLMYPRWNGKINLPLELPGQIPEIPAVNGF